MGVRGLTSFIARKAEIYLKPHELHDCNLAIDGDSLSCNLYKDVAGTYSSFGGDYDDFYRAVVEFFQILAECNVHAYVIMDGGYERKKLRTVNTRLRNKIAVIKRINPNESFPLFPLHIKEVFIDAARDCDIPVMRCAFEADDELAALARKINCPVLSYDSDFYIHNVSYIPIVTLTLKVYTKEIDVKTEEPISNRKNRNLTPKILNNSRSSHDNIIRENPFRKTYKYLDCCIYRIEHLCNNGRDVMLSPEKLPLFAALLGNDYIGSSVFRNLIIGLGRDRTGRNFRPKKEQQRINAILKWLSQETMESALNKILTRLKKDQRDSLIAQVESATIGYSNENCHSYDFFLKHYNESFKKFAWGNVTNNDTYSKELLEEAVFNSNFKDIEKLKKKTINSEYVFTSNFVEYCSDDSSNSKSEESHSESDLETDEIIDKTTYFPAWFLEKLYPVQLPRFCVDLLFLRKYISNPQIEHFPFNDCNEITLPVLKYIYALLINAKVTDQKINCEPKNFTFTYLSRAVRVTNIQYMKYSVEELCPLKYDYMPYSPDQRHLRIIFEELMPHLNVELLFNKVFELPNDLQLYFLSIVYWILKSQHCDLLHLHALIICVVVLRTVDVTIPAERDLKQFEKRFGKIIKKEREMREKTLMLGKKRTLKPELLKLTISQRMMYIPKSDCYLVQQRLLPHFHMQEIFKRKYDKYSTIVLHAFAEFQAVIYQLNGLNALLDFPHVSPRMGQLYCGVFLYNIYHLLKSRPDVKYYVKKFIFDDSQLMYDFYDYLYKWCDLFIPKWKQQSYHENVIKLASKKINKKQRQKKRKETHDLNVLQQNDNESKNDDGDDDDDGDNDDDSYNDVNNKFYKLKSC